FKWNMGWMHDTLDYFGVDPFFRRGAHDKLTFALMYEYSEKFVNPLSHDEVVHLKKSLLEKMPGDVWQRFANLRALLGYTITRPGKSLLFMGTELAPAREWNHDASLEWHLARDPRRKGIDLFLEELGALYNAHSCFWRRDHEPSGFSWIDVADKLQSVLSYARFDGAQHVIVVLNLTPVPRTAYRIGTPATGTYRYALNSDEERFGGSGFEVPVELGSEPLPYHGFPQSIELTLPPLSMLVLMPYPMPTEAVAPSGVDDVAAALGLGQADSASGALASGLSESAGATGDGAEDGIVREHTAGRDDSDRTRKSRAPKKAKHTPSGRKDQVDTARTSKATAKGAGEKEGKRKSKKKKKREEDTPVVPSLIVDAPLRAKVVKRARTKRPPLAPSSHLTDPSKEKRTREIDDTPPTPDDDN
ncbi:MAG: alpha amylase C-terminal domain-containing protein, partial [Gemmatimonas sp.]